ncbi:MAG: YlxR family protein [Phormidesmis sp. CAN_BIN44]|nr:YlxR family protein [Phormidesmis sp. CAN_BIN44]
MEPNYRRCVSCRRSAPKYEFWRVVRSHSSGTIVLDQGTGRSAYLCPQSECLKAAQKKDRLSRVLKASVSDQIYKALWQRLSETTSLPTTGDLGLITSPDLPTA